MPVRYRRWFLQRLVRHFEDKNATRKKATEPLKQQDNSESLDMFSRFENQVKNKLS